MNQDNKSILTFTPADSFKNIVAETLELARASGATQAEAGLSVSQGLSVATRMAEVETIEHQQDNGLGISVYIGQHKGSASTSNLDPEAIRKTVEEGKKKYQETLGHSTPGSHRAGAGM